MAVEVALDDDVYFADLNRQISLLIDEDDDNDDYQVPHFSTTAPQGYVRSMIHHNNNAPILPTQYMYQESCRREMCKGTGVFIPQSTQPRRKHKPGKRSSASYAAKSNNNNKQFVNSKSRTNNTAASNNNNNNNNINTKPAYATEYFNRY